MKCLVLNTQSIVSKNKTGAGNETAWNLHRFQDLVYSESADVVFVSEYFAEIVLTDVMAEYLLRY